MPLTRDINTSKTRKSTSNSSITRDVQPIIMYILAPEMLPSKPPSMPGTTRSTDSQKSGSHGLSKRTLIIMLTALAGAALFVLVFAAIHCIRRHRRSTQKKQEQQDIERSLRRAEIARLVRDSDVPARPNEMRRSASTSKIPKRVVAEEELPLPLLSPVRTAPPMFQIPEIFDPVERVRSPTRKGSCAPGVGGRVADWIRQIENVGIQKPVQIYDPAQRRTIYLG